jgi:two-component system, OmpR family, sensor kinase
VSRVPIRLRLTAAFAFAMVVVLVAAGVFVYVRLRDDLNESITAGLQTRASAVAASGEASAGASGDSEEGFAQVLGPDGKVVDLAGGLSEAALDARERGQVADGEVLLLEHRVPGIEGTARILARSADGSQIVVVGESLDDRNETLAGLVTSFAFGGPVAVLVASLLGYLLASVGLAPVEAMRRRAGRISLADDRDRLPLPPAHDEVRRLGETLNEMLDRLRRSYERERRFVADAGHELRTPLAVIKAELEGALRSGRHDPQVREALVAAVEECDGLAHLAEDLLVVARSGDGELPLRPERVSVDALLAGIEQRFGDRAHERGRSIRVEGTTGLSVHADELRMRQALGNLVDNALRHGAGDILLCAHNSQEGVSLEVSDSGEGFAEDVADRAFERFARGDEARTREGAGLGLSIVRAIAEAHGGRAELVPSERTTTVRIWLPNSPQRPLSRES